MFPVWCLWWCARSVLLHPVALVIFRRHMVLRLALFGCVRCARWVGSWHKADLSDWERQTFDVNIFQSYEVVKKAETWKSNLRDETNETWNASVKPPTSVLKSAMFEFRNWQKGRNLCKIIVKSLHIFFGNAKGPWHMQSRTGTSGRSRIRHRQSDGSQHGLAIHSEFCRFPTVFWWILFSVPAQGMKKHLDPNSHETRFEDVGDFIDHWDRFVWRFVGKWMEPKTLKTLFFSIAKMRIAWIARYSLDQKKNIFEEHWSIRSILNPAKLGGEPIR